MSFFPIQIAFFLSFSLCSPLFFGNNHADANGGNHIDRKALVNRHVPTLTKADTLSPFTVGNGEFAFTTDVTGLQTFAGLYENGIPLGTQSQWGWHTNPNPNSYSLDQTFEYHDSHGRQVPYACKQNSEAGQWLRSNPHRLHLGSIGFKITKANGSEIQLPDITDIDQSADIWEGIIKSFFKIENENVFVETGCHPAIDQIAVRIKSTLLQKGKIGVHFDFPYGSTSWGKTSADWNSPDKHSSDIIFQSGQSATIERKLDSDKYYVNLQWNGAAKLNRVARHSFLLAISKDDHFEFTCSFSAQRNTEPLPDAAETLNASRMHWQNFWETGGAVDLSESRDPRAFELERRIVLSRYPTAIQCAGSTPPQETGLTFNSWHGKFHLEMHWWHAVQFVLWGHPELLERSLPWYKATFPMAAQTAKRQGYDGVRWPKMVGRDGRESPSSVGVFLIWQQPHPLYYSELLYRYRKDQTTLERYKDIVFATADFMASFAQWDDRNGRYVLGPPLIPAQEIYKPDSTMNPGFELSYWAYGLKLAQRWRERLGLPHVEKWDHVIRYISKLPLKRGLYQNAETALKTFENSFDRNDHPAVLGAFGMLPNDSIDVSMMRETLEKVLSSWNWARTWGWDYPLIAMTAARVGKPDLAIEALLMNTQKNTYLNNGHNFQDERLPIYLPGNGALLTAVAMMAAGWDGAPDVRAPGFPKDGKWVVRYEGLRPLP